MRILEIGCDVAASIAKEKVENHGWINNIDELMLERHLSECQNCIEKLNQKLDLYKN